MDYHVDLYLRQSWEDPRLVHPNITRALDLSDPNMVKAIWKPEIFFPNAKEGEFQYVTVPNVLIRINPNGSILYMLRLKLTFSCMMDLSKYPLDRQVCTMEIASFAKTVGDLKLQWKEPQPVTMYGGLKMPQFEIRNIRHLNCQSTYLSEYSEYSCILAEFDLQRAIGFHLVQSYLPTMLVVVISWVSFWMDVEAVPGRVTLGITTLLTVSSKASGVQSNLPQVSYVKALDVWMTFATGFVFAALLEFTHVNYLWRKTSTSKKQSERKMKGETWVPLNLNPGKTKSEANMGDDQEKLVDDQSNKMAARRIDELSRFAFPISFFIFNICYWCYYLN